MKSDNQSHLCNFCSEITILYRVFNSAVRTRICSKCHVSYKLRDYTNQFKVSEIRGVDILSPKEKVSTKLINMTFFVTIKDHYDYRLTFDYITNTAILWNSFNKIKDFADLPQGITPANVKDKCKMYLTFL